MPVKLALSTLCEHPHRRTGLTTLFHEFVKHGLQQFPEIRWIVFAGPATPWELCDERVEVIRRFPANERRNARLWSDHFLVAPAARRRGAACLLTVGFMPLRTAGLPVAMHVFSFHHDRGRGMLAWYRRAAVARGLRRAALVIVNSRWAAAQLKSTRAPVVVSYEGVQHDRFSPNGRRGSNDTPGEYFLWIGNFYRYKRAELALAAYARLPAVLRARFPFVLVGGDWEGGRARAERCAAELGIAQEVRFKGWISDDELPALYRGARGHVLASSEETFGRSVAEAMACGCVSVLQDLPVLREVTNGAALFVDYTDTGSVVAALQRICTDESLVGVLREKGLRRAADFTFEKLARERIEAILASIRRVAPR